MGEEREGWRKGTGGWEEQGQGEGCAKVAGCLRGTRGGLRALGSGSGRGAACGWAPLRPLVGYASRTALRVCPLYCCVS